MREAEVAQHVRRRRAGRQRRAERLDRFVETANLAVGDAQAVERLDMVRVELQRLPEPRDRRIDAAFGEVEAADRIVARSSAGGLLHAVDRCNLRSLSVGLYAERRAAGDQGNGAGAEKQPGTDTLAHCDLLNHGATFAIAVSRRPTSSAAGSGRSGSSPARAAQAAATER
ncbi:MAG: hypothetical protein M5U30_02315 [Burkholderiaceae bacterium]|nr:hypothetical protein [Burkholderiaceae bacterium]